MFTTKKNVPIPRAIRAAPPTRRKYPFDTLEVGAMFFVPGRTKNNLSKHASTMGKKLKRKFVTRLTHMRETLGGWEPCDETEKGATLGIGVWRVKP